MKWTLPDLSWSICSYREKGGEVDLKDAGAIGLLSEAIPAKAVVFRKTDPGYDCD